jgi:dTMP kinase
LLGATLARLFAADRSEHIFNPVDGNTPSPFSERNVICDRYAFSSWPNQSLPCGFDFVLSLNKDFPLLRISLYRCAPLDLRGETEGAAAEGDIRTRTPPEACIGNYRKTLELYADSGLRSQ